MQQGPYAGFWIRAAARFIDMLAIIAAYFIFYQGNQLGAGLGLLPPISNGAPQEGTFSFINVIRGLFLLGFPVFYFSYMHGAWGQTFGKMAMKIRVLNEDGSPLTYAQAFRRWMVEIVFGFVLVFLLLVLLVVVTLVVEYVLSKISSVISVMNYLQDAFSWIVGLVIVVLSNIPIGIMFIPVAFDPHKQGLHDRICRTIVVRVAEAGRSPVQAPPPADDAPLPAPSPAAGETSGPAGTHPAGE